MNALKSLKYLQSKITVHNLGRHYWNPRKDGGMERENFNDKMAAIFAAKYFSRICKHF